MKRYFLFIWLLVQVYMTSLSKLDALSLRALHVLFILSLSSLFFLENKKLSKPMAFLSVLSLGLFLYLYPGLAQTGGRLETIHIVLGLAILVLILVLAFYVNRALFVLSLVFLTYLYWGQFIPGPLGHSGFSLYRVTSYMVWGSQGIFGLGVGVSMSYIFLFVLYGALLNAAGFTKMIYSIAGRFLRGQVGAGAKLSILASGLMGMINGSAVANVATTGTVTIPLMKKTGYQDDYAAAVEAAASTGGQFCPPIMGAVGFVMAEYLKLPYKEVMVAAILPALIYYLSLFFQVHYQAKKLGLAPMEEEGEKPKRQDFLPLLSILVLLVLINRGYTPIYSVLWAIGVLLVTMQFHKESPLRGDRLVQGLMEGGQTALKVGLACILIGFIIGSVTLSGFGINFGELVLSTLAKGNLFIGAFFVMILSVILGMGVPGLAAYIIVASVAVPVLIKLDASPLGAHMFCLYYGVLSNITPPVAISCYVASSMAGSDPWKTGFTAMKIAFAGFILPFVFLFNPALLAQGDLVNLVEVTLTALYGTYLFALALAGYWQEPLSGAKRLVLFMAGLALLVPGLLSDGLGLALSLPILWFSRKKKEGIPC